MTLAIRTPPPEPSFAALPTATAHRPRFPHLFPRRRPATTSRQEIAAHLCRALPRYDPAAFSLEYRFA